jgi:hypothetical protein
MYIKTSFFDIVHEVKKDLQDVSAGTGIKNKVFFIIFSAM